MVVVLDGVFDLLEGILGVVHAEGEAVQQVGLEGLQMQRGVGGCETAVVVPDAGRLLQGGNEQHCRYCDFFSIAFLREGLEKIKGIRLHE